MYTYIIYQFGNVSGDKSQTVIVYMCGYADLEYILMHPRSPEMKNTRLFIHEYNV